MAQGTKTKSRSSARAAAGSGRKAQSAAQHAPRGASAPVGRAANIVAAQQAAATGTKAAGRAVAAAKAPLIIGGAAVTGVVGGLMANRHRRRSKRSPLAGLLRRDGSLDLESVASAARRLGSLSESVAEMAATAQSSRRR